MKPQPGDIYRHQPIYGKAVLKDRLVLEVFGEDVLTVELGWGRIRTMKKWDLKRMGRHDGRKFLMWSYLERRIDRLNRACGVEATVDL